MVSGEKSGASEVRTYLRERGEGMGGESVSSHPVSVEKQLAFT